MDLLKGMSSPPPIMKFDALSLGVAAVMHCPDSGKYYAGDFGWCWSELRHRVKPLTVQRSTTSVIRALEFVT